jgi:hypothetical protein
MERSVVLLVLSLVLIGGTVMDSGATEKRDVVSGTGTVRYLSLEGGFHGIESDDGKKYDPSGLPKEFQQDGLRVRFTVKVLQGVMTIRMWGTPVEVLSIEKL